MVWVNVDKYQKGYTMSGITSTKLTFTNGAVADIVAATSTLTLKSTSTATVPVPYSKLANDIRVSNLHHSANKTEVKEFFKDSKAIK